MYRPTIKNTAVTVALAAALNVLIIPAHAQSLPAQLVGTLDCSATVGQARVSWTVELDDTVPLAVVDDAEAPAEYSKTHVRVRLAATGPALFIGRGTGRLLVSAPDGSALGIGRCRSLVEL